MNVTDNKDYQTVRTVTDSDVLVKVEHVSKKFCRDLKKSLWYGIKDIATELIPGTGSATRHSILRPAEFWAVNDVSFELRRGECLGLIGRNGAGKTTLLKMLNGLIKPDRGRIEMRGRVGALIALGAGFNPVLTGRENIYVNGSVLGLSKREIDERLEEIIDFAEIGDFIDTPVQNYSSGMAVRLGFAVATIIKPDVLIIDEVLAVGDAAFRGKCYNQIDRIAPDSAIIFVSHSMEQVGRICNKSLVLQDGKVAFCGAIGPGMGAYRGQCSEKGGGFVKVYPPIESCRLRLRESAIAYGGELEIEVALTASADTDLVPRAVIFNGQGEVVAEGNASFNGMPPVTSGIGERSFVVRLGGVSLQGGVYRLSLNLHACDGLVVHAHRWATFSVTAPDFGESAYQLPMSAVSLTSVQDSRALAGE